MTHRPRRGTGRPSAVRHALFAVVVLVCLACDGAPSPSPSEQADVQESFEIVEGWAGAPSAGAFGRVLGVAIAPDGRVWVSHTADGEARNDAPIAGASLAVLDPTTGALVEELGRNRFRLPHALAFDVEGRLWVTDSDANRITVLDQSGATAFELGAR